MVVLQANVLKGGGILHGAQQGHEAKENVSVANNACWAIGEVAVKVYLQRSLKVCLWTEQGGFQLLTKLLHLHFM
jgi:hypothetical protein